MKLFVSEYVCSGAWPEEDLSPSLAREGRAMLLALLEDCARLPDVEVWTTWDRRRLGPFPLSGVRCVEVECPTQEQEWFRSLAGGCDAAYVIAPELDNVLAERRRAVAESCGRSLNATCDAIALCSDKLRLAHCLDDADIPTVPTSAAGPGDPPFGLPVVIKLRFGAGSHGIHTVATVEEYRSRCNGFQSPDPHRQAVVQPRIEGRSVSVAAIFDDRGACRHVLPVAQQVLSRDGRYRYLGGRLPAGTLYDDVIAETISRAAAIIQGLRGYVGFDFVIPEEEARPLLVEVNPRLTTSYLGYRALATDNLTEFLVFPQRERDPVRCGNGLVEFTPAGAIRRDDRQLR